MKILQLGKFYPIKGGVEKVMYDLMTGLSEEGLKCDMLCAACDDDHVGEEPLNENATLMRTRTLAKVKATMLSPAMISKMRSICNEYDVVHVHHPDPMACLALYMSGYKGKVALHWHSDILKQKNLLKLYQPLQKWLIDRADMIIGTSPVYLESSPWLKDVQDKTVCLPIGVVPLEVDNEKAAALREKYKGRKIIFSLGRLVPYKGYKYLIDSARYLDDSYVVLIGGEGPLKDSLREQIESSGLQDKVRLLGFLSDEEVAAYFGACDLFCMSSVYATEAFGIVQIEAMSAGKPVVATRIPGSGVSWVNAHKESGINVEPKDSEALAKAFKSILESEDTYNAFAEQASRRYHEMFTKSRMIENCIEIYKSI
jgi:rhamnosyl/mannosyltransferase